MRIIILLFFILNPFNISILGQNINFYHLDSLTMDFVNELQCQNIDTICIYKDYCVGCVHVVDSCSSNHFFMSIYILWASDGKTFLHKKDNCFNYTTIEIDAQPMWNIFFKHQRKIQKEEVKIFEYQRMRKGVRFIKFINHSYFREFSFFIEDKIIKMNFDEYDLKKDDNGIKNINYSHNQNLKGKLLVDELDNLIRGLEGESLLVRDGWVR